MRRIAAARATLGARLAGEAASGPGDRETAAFRAFVERSERGAFAGFPARWRVEHPPLADPAPIGVVLHVYYPELVPELVAALASLEVAFDVLATNASAATADEIAAALAPLEAPGSACRSVRVLDVENRGRDLWPLAQLANAGLLDPYDLLLKLHTKRSAWRDEHELAGTGEQWRASLIGDLVGDPERVRAILAGLIARPEVGIATGEGSICGSDHWGANRVATRELLRRLGLEGLERDPRLRFASGSMYWMRGFLAQGLRALQLEAADFPDEDGRIDGTTAHALERALGVLAAEAGFAIAEASDVARAGADADGASDPAELGGRLADPAPIARAIAYYLPQFHPLPENDAWWGEGFTEWSNVARARPAFPGHAQPLLPADLGFYDLRLDEVRERQAQLARRAGLAGLMYYHYWFAGTTLMGLPIERLVGGDVEQPFCLMWANENWTRRWDGRDEDVLIAQDHEGASAEAFFDDVAHLLADPRYLRVDGAALLGVYRIGQIPDFPAVAAAWRRRARELGIGELRIVAADVDAAFDGPGNAEAAGIDGVIAFPPHRHLKRPAARGGLGVRGDFRGNIYDYGATARDAQRRLAESQPDARRAPGVMVAFDNTARRGLAADVWRGANPYTFRRWLRCAAESLQSLPEPERIVIVNAWNEWAEGAVLEPTRRWGRTFLLATRSAIMDARR